MGQVNSKYHILGIFTNYALFEIFILGILSGLPFSILYTSLVMMMKDLGVPLAMVTGLAIARIPYSLKFLWAPFIDGVRIPFLEKLGRRKSWMIVVTALKILVLWFIIEVASVESYRTVQMLAILFGFLAATYDIAYDAWRIERVGPEMQAINAAIAVFGYRMGALITAGGVLYLVGVTGSWNKTLMIIIGLFFIGMLFILTVPDKGLDQAKKTSFNIKENVIEPFKDFLGRPMAISILITIVLYKAGEAMLGFVSTPFYQDLGFSKQEIASVVKVFGVVATTLGTIAGGLVSYRLGAIRGLLVCGIVQMISNLTFIWLNAQGPQLHALFVTVAVDNFTGGMGAAALVGYLGMLCNRQYTATQYALLSSATTLVNNTLTAYSGSLVEYLGWNQFFIFTVILSLPALAMLLYLGRRLED